MKIQNCFCPQCGSKGSILYPSIEDYYFGSTGHWDYYLCNNVGCAVAWPFPALDDEALANAYSHYYTHEAQANSSFLIYTKACLARFIHKSGFYSALNHLIRLPLIGRTIEDIFITSGAITPVHNGKILDVGCGSGDRLVLFKQVGWVNAVGVELDNQAVLAATALGRNVRQGAADALPIESSSMDAVVMHHVIEHVRNPTKVLAEAYRVLISGHGRLILITPNIASQMRIRWGRHWRGFEAPRHLTIFTISALCDALVSVGFKVEMARSSARSVAWINKISATAAGVALPSNQGNAIYNDFIYLQQTRLIASGSQIGDEIVIIASKP